MSVSNTTIAAGAVAVTAIAVTTVVVVNNNNKEKEQEQEQAAEIAWDSKSVDLLAECYDDSYTYIAYYKNFMRGQIGEFDIESSIILQDILHPLAGTKETPDRYEENFRSNFNAGSPDGPQFPDSILYPCDK